MDAGRGDEILGACVIPGSVLVSNMSTVAESATIEEKVRDLCETIVVSEEYLKLIQRVEAFLADEASREQYEKATLMGEELQNKQRMGIELQPVEVTSFEKQREGLFENPTISQFLDAQRELSAFNDHINRMVKTTIELGRVPTAEELASESSGCCGGGSCGC